MPASALDDEPAAALEEVDRDLPCGGAMVVRLGPIPRLTPEQFVEFCQANDGLRIELSADGD